MEPDGLPPRRVRIEGHSRDGKLADRILLRMLHQLRTCLIAPARSRHRRVVNDNVACSYQADPGQDDRCSARRLSMKRCALLLLLVLGTSGTVWANHIGMCYTGSNLIAIHWAGWGLWQSPCPNLCPNFNPCPNPCPNPDPCPAPDPCPDPDPCPNPNPCPNPCWPHGPFWGTTSSTSTSYASTTGPGSTAVAETSGQSYGYGSYSSSYSYSYSSTP